MNRIDLEKAFPEQFKILSQLFSSNKVREKINRLNRIHSKCKADWNRNLDRLRKTQVKYILIAEAPPWSENGPIEYFYTTFSGSWCKRIWNTFFYETAPKDINETLTRLAKKHFLLIDSLPFSMNYSINNIRNKNIYLDLVKSCRDYMYDQLHDRRINWSKNVKIALAFKLNGNAIMNASPTGIDLPNGQNVKLCQSNIAVDGSNYTNPEKLKNIWDLKGIS